MSSLDRRQFSLLPLLAAPLFLRKASAAPSPQFPPPMRPKDLLLGARVLPEGEEDELTARLERILASGFDGVEVVWPGAFRADRVQRAAERAKCPIHGLHISDDFGAALSTDDEPARARGEKRLADGLRLAAELGATSLSLVAGAITPTVSDARAWNQVKIALKTALPLAQELDLRIGLRLGAGEFLAAPFEAARFIDELNSPHLAWQLDVAWSLVHSYPQHWAHIIGGRLLKVDLADYSRSIAETAGRARGMQVALGEGSLDCPTTLEALAHASYSGWVTIDVDESSEATLAADEKRARAWLAG